MRRLGCSMDGEPNTTCSSASAAGRSALCYDSRTCTALPASSCCRLAFVSLRSHSSLRRRRLRRDRAADEDADAGRSARRCPRLRRASCASIRWRAAARSSRRGWRRWSRSCSAECSELGGKGKPPPYYIAYEIHDRNDVTVAASYGALVQSSVRHSRILDTDVRVGDYKLDSTHSIRSNDFDFSSVTGGHPVALPLSDDPTALRTVAWRETDRRYNDAAERLVKIRTQRTLKVADDDPSDDFSREKPASYLGAPAALTRRRPRLGAKDPPAVRALSRPGGHPRLGRDASGVQPDALAGQLGRHDRADGTQLRARLPGGERARGRRHGAGTVRDFDAASARRPGSNAEMDKAADAIIADLRALRKAPLADPYIGPAILEGRAAGVFFHEIFGHRVEGHRQKNEEEGQTFAKKVGEPIMPAFVVGVRRSDAVAAGRRRSQRLLSLRRRGRGGAARDAGRRTAC